MMRTITGAVILSALVAVPAFCQQSPAFDIADVHVSPRADWVKNQVHRMDGGVLGGDRYGFRRATLLDLIRIAYTVDPVKVSGGPSWIDYDRFEIVAKTRPGTRPAALKLMLQNLLADRFRLVLKTETQPVPGYLLKTGKGKLNISAAADSSGPSGCQNNPVVEGETRYNNIQCHNVTMAELAAFLKGPLSHPVLDSTGIEGNWDFDLQYPLVNLAAAAGGRPGMVDAVQKIGLKLEDGKVPQPVISVESANEQPSPNPPGVAQALPPLPTPEFEVASMKLSGGQGPTRPLRYDTGRVVADGMPPGSLIAQAFNQVSYEQPVGTPKSWGSGVAHNVTIIAKAPAGIAADQDSLNAMLRALVIDRYKMKFHFEEHPMDANTLVAVKPKLTKANPANRTGCIRQPQQRPDGARVTRLVCPEHDNGAIRGTDPGV